MHRSAYVILLLISQAQSSTPIHQPQASSTPQRTETNASGTQPPEVVASKTADDRIATYTLWLTVVTGGLLVIAFRQDQQIRREFISTHRPRLRIRQVEFNPENGERAASMTAILVNVGDSTARIVDVLASEWEGKAMRPPFMPARADRKPLATAGVSTRRLKSGETALITFEADELQIHFARRTEYSDLIPLMFYCTVRYADDRKTHRHTSHFGWLNEAPPVTIFKPVPEQPDYNYED